jgi:4-hydroxybenzoate polyprenyltransferase
MRGFAFLIALLGIFIFLLFQFSFWTAFAAMYLFGLVLVAVFAFFGKQQSSSPVMWNESVEIE